MPTVVNACSVYFFFSSRRRHTRLTCDWSSDVCSSDLVERDRRADARNHDAETAQRLALVVDLEHAGRDAHVAAQRIQHAHRSEERRVGKECRYRGSSACYKRIMHVSIMMYCLCECQET